MEDNQLKDIFCHLVFEVVERVSRFNGHLDEIAREFYNDEDRIVKDKLSFIRSYKECLRKYFSIALLYYKKAQEDNFETVRPFLNSIESVLRSINDLQVKYLIYLPRPTEPVELRRFARIIKKQVVNIEGGSSEPERQISIYINEQIGETAFASDPLQNIKHDDINALVLDLNTKMGEDLLRFFEGSNESVDEAIHITISRIDANNPCHWPSLLHEVAHKLMHKDFFRDEDILSDFRNYARDVQSEAMLDVLLDSLQVDIRLWLTECWCDLFACLSIGPTFYFSQFHLFLNDFGKDRNYPPPTFRILLIDKILHHRFENIWRDPQFKEAIELSKSIVEYFEKNHRHKYNDNPNVRRLFMLFKEYFHDHLFKPSAETVVTLNNPELSQKFAKTLRYVAQINPDIIQSLTSDLEKGFPIPSKIESVDPHYVEVRTSVQEILFASWNFRSKTFKERILDRLNVLREGFGPESQEIKMMELAAEIERDVGRFDQAVLRSIQISEYVDALDAQDMLQDNISRSEYQSQVNHSLLVDWEIFDCIKEKQIRIIPIISLKHQQGSTSFDIRLGTTFELYLPNQFGIVDFASLKSVREISKSSQKANLDFLESIAINPGQFILGHSMEYLSLPQDISADLEGRSSFARLGIEIHMTAGFVDPGFQGVLTFEIFNAGPSPVRLYPGMRIGQLRFTRTTAPARSYMERNTAKYAGLLEYHSSKQSKDYEVQKIIKLKEATEGA